MLPHDIHAPTNPNKPEPVGFCDRCNAKWHLDRLQFQYDWRGNALVNLNIRVCPDCLDKPFEHNRPIIIGPDPVVPPYPRPGFQQTEEGVSNVPNSVQEILG